MGTGGVHFFLCAIIIVSLCALKWIARLFAVYTLGFSYHVTCSFNLRPVARFVEFGRALVEKMLADGSTSYRYFGFLNEAQFAETSKHVTNQVYQSWDTAASSPPRTRPRDEEHSSGPPDLQILGYHDGQPFWPEMLKSRFEEGTDEHEKLKSLYEKFTKMFPASQQSSPGTSTAPEARTPGRAGGLCDYTIDEGAQPVDITRQIELSLVKNEDFTDQRLGSILGSVVSTIM